MPNLKMPVLFIGHGSPMNIVNKNAYTQSLQSIRASLPPPKVILVVSAHWLTKGTFVCCTDTPKQIYDFYGFPDALYRVHYRPPGARKIGEALAAELKTDNIQIDTERGIDHAAWSVLVHLYPKADIPVFEMSLDVTKSEEDHYALGKKLSFLRQRNILIIGSGNIVHNLVRMQYEENAQQYPWALEFDQYIREALLQKDTGRLFRYKDSSTVGKIAAPTNDHYLPMLYSAALQEDNEQIDFFHESMQNASVSMRCFIIR